MGQTSQQGEEGCGYVGEIYQMGCKGELMTFYPGSRVPFNS